MDDFRLNEHKVFNGWAQALVRAKPGFDGALKVTATAEGCEPISVKIIVKRKVR